MRVFVYEGSSGRSFSQASVVDPLTPQAKGPARQPTPAKHTRDDRDGLSLHASVMVTLIPQPPPALRHGPIKSIKRRLSAQASPMDVHLRLFRDPPDVQMRPQPQAPAAAQAFNQGRG